MRNPLHRIVLWMSFLCALFVSLQSSTIEAGGRADVVLGGSLPISLGGNWSATDTTSRTEIRGPSSSEPQFLLIETNHSENKGYNLQVDPFDNAKLRTTRFDRN
ncbi:MAG: hypothetical protein ABIR96_12905 [Bdellovibrionota bacterium]